MPPERVQHADVIFVHLSAEVLWSMAPSNAAMRCLVLRAHADGQHNNPDWWTG